MEDQQLFAELERKADSLIQLCAELQAENAALKAEQRQWQAERAQLIQKNEYALNKIESMIIRLKALEPR